MAQSTSHVSPAKIFARPAAQDIWLGPAQRAALSHVFARHRHKYLIGPPSCGKTTTRQLIHHLLDGASGDRGWASEPEAEAESAAGCEARTDVGSAVDRGADAEAQGASRSWRGVEVGRRGPRALRARQARRSYNNHIGVPLTLLAARASDDVLVVEVGTNHPGEIAALAAIVRPEAAVLTHVGAAHLGHFRDLDAIAAEKASLFDAVTPPDAAGTEARETDMTAGAADHDAQDHDAQEQTQDQTRDQTQDQTRDQTQDQTRDESGDADPGLTSKPTVGAENARPAEPHGPGLSPPGPHTLSPTLTVRLGDEPRLQFVQRSDMVTFGVEPENDLIVRDVEAHASGVRFTLASGPTPAPPQRGVARTLRRQPARLTMPLLGAHNALNAAAAIVVARWFGLDESTIAQRLASARLPGMRLEIQQAGGVTFINDAYNANPDSMRAALDTLATFDPPAPEGEEQAKAGGAPAARGGRRVAVLGDMLELGEHAPALHRELGEAVAGFGRSIDHVDFVGPMSLFAAEVVSRSWSEDRCGMWPDHADETLMQLARTFRPGDVVLLKASRSIGLDRLVGLTEDAGASGGSAQPGEGAEAKTNVKTNAKVKKNGRSSNSGRSATPAGRNASDG